jgi:hypothetical protein
MKQGSRNLGERVTWCEDNIVQPRLRKHWVGIGEGYEDGSLWWKQGEKMYGSLMSSDKIIRCGTPIKRRTLRVWLNVSNVGMISKY